MEDILEVQGGVLNISEAQTLKHLAASKDIGLVTEMEGIQLSHGFINQKNVTVSNAISLFSYIHLYQYCK